MFEQLRNKIKTYSEQRYEICKQCPKKIQATNQCGICGCPVGSPNSMKLLDPLEKCPDTPKRW